MKFISCINVLQRPRTHLVCALALTSNWFLHFNGWNIHFTISVRFPSSKFAEIAWSLARIQLEILKTLLWKGLLH